MEHPILIDEYRLSANSSYFGDHAAGSRSGIANTR